MTLPMNLEPITHHSTPKQSFRLTSRDKYSIITH